MELHSLFQIIFLQGYPSLMIKGGGFDILI